MPICTTCKKEFEGTTKRCDKCREVDRRSLKKRREYRRLNGLCLTCGKPSPDSNNCEECATKIRNMANKRNKKMKEKGICIRCGAPVEGNGMRCRSCLDNHNEQVREKKDFYRSKGRCPLCGEKLFGDEKNCLECRTKINIYKMSRWEKPTDYKEKENAYKKKLREHRKEQGVCARCGKNRPLDGRVTCGICRSKVSEYEKKYRMVKSDENKKDKTGLCSWCDKPVYKDFKLCEEHYNRILRVSHSDGANAHRDKIKNIERARIINQGIIKGMNYGTH